MNATNPTATAHIAPSAPSITPQPAATARTAPSAPDITHQPAATARTAPSAPNITHRDLLRQVWLDAYGKEVQSAATYSYMWLADQVGHVCVGILVNFVVTWIAGGVIYAYRAYAGGAGIDEILYAAWHAPYTAGALVGLALALIGPAYWELSAYRSSVKEATGTFPLDEKLLRANAIIAATYMGLGGVIGYAFHTPTYWAVLIVAVAFAIGILLAPDWVRQKMIWQKGAIPYLFRLADAAPTISAADARELQNLLDEGAPPATRPCQVVIGGPIGAGRTPLAAGIGTEFAFRKCKVRYLGLDELLEFAVSANGYPLPDDAGPATIGYWPWSEAQVLIIDDVGPLIAAHAAAQKASLKHFTELLDKSLKPIAPVLAQRHTVWVIGDLRPPSETKTFHATLDEFAGVIGTFCGSQGNTMVIELGLPRADARRNGKGAHVSHVRRIACPPAQAPVSPPH